MNIYVDFDDCICETARDLAELASKLFHKNVPYEKISTFDLHDAFLLTDTEYQTLMHIAHTDEIILSYTETPNASLILNKLLDAGHNITIVTGRPYHTKSASLLWLQNHNLSRLPILHVDKYGREPPTTSPNRSFTLQEFHTLHFDLAIEDSPEALQHLHFPTIIFSRPWNLTYPTHPHASSWLEISSLISSL